MRKILWLMLLLVGLGGSAFAQSYEKIQLYCEKGGETVTTDGRTSTTRVQRSYPSCTVTVYDGGTLNLASIASDSNGTPKSNPFTADSDGYISFYATDGTYDVKMSGSGLAAPITRSGFWVITSAGGGSGITGSGSTNRFPIFTSSTAIGNSVFQQVGTSEFAPASTGKRINLGTGSQQVVEVANAAVTGTTQNRLAKLTGAPSTAVIATTTDTTKLVGIVIAGAGTTGNAQIVTNGNVTCEFDGSTTAGNYVGASTTTNGKCTDLGASLPNTGVQVIGRVLETIGSAGNATVFIFTGEQGRGGTSGSGTTAYLSYWTSSSALGATNSYYDTLNNAYTFGGNVDVANLGNSEFTIETDQVIFKGGVSRANNAIMQTMKATATQTGDFQRFTTSAGAARFRVDIDGDVLPRGVNYTWPASLPASTGCLQITSAGVMSVVSCVSGIGVRYALNVKQAPYNCVGDGVTDDTTCFQDAIDDATLAGGYMVYAPAATYKVTGLSVPGGVILTGDGRAKTIIYSNTDAVIVNAVVGSGAYAFKGPEIYDLQILGSGNIAHTSQIGLQIDDPTYFLDVVVQDVEVTQTGSHGVYFGKVFSSYFESITAGSSMNGYPFLFNQINMPGNTFRNLYAADVNSSSPAGYRIRSGNITCWGCNGINNSSSNSWWAIIGDKVGVDGAVANRAAYLNCIDCNIESSRAGGILHYYNSRTDLSGTTLFSGDGGSAGTYIALKYEVDSAIFPPFFVKGVLSPSTIFANSPLSYYANSEVIHANDLPPVSIEGAVRQADGNLINTYYNTTNARSEAVYRVDGARPVTTITATASFTNPGATNYEANCAAPCTLTLPWPSWYTTNTDYIYVRNIGAGTLTINANSGGTVNSGGSYTLVTGESVVFMPHTASADYRLVGLQGAGAANRIPYFDGVQHLTSSANLTYDGTTVLNQKAGGNPYFAANDTTNNITTRFGPLAGAPDRAIIGTISNHPFGLYANNAERWTVGTAGHFTPGAANTTDLGSVSLPARSGYFGTSLLLGIGSSVTGQVVFSNSSNTNTTTLISGAPSSSISITLPATLPASAGCLQISSTGVITQTGSACGAGGGSVEWQALTNPTGNQALAMAAFTTAWTWNATTGANNLFTLTDTASNTGTGYIASIGTAASSSAKPIRITAGGTSNGVEMTTAGALVAIGSGEIRANMANPSATIGLTANNGSATTAMRSDATPALSQAITPTWTGLHVFNPGTTPTTAALIDINSLGTAGTRDSNWLVMRGRSNDGSARLTEWKQFVDVNTNAGGSLWSLESRIDAASFATRFTVSDAGAVSAGAFSGTSFTDDGGSAVNDDINAATGFTVAGAAASGQYLRGNGTRAVFAAIASGDLPSTVVRTDQANTYSTGAQSFSSATSLTLPVSAGAAPTANGAIAFDSTANDLEYGDNGTNRKVANLDEAQTFTNKTLTSPTINGGTHTAITSLGIRSTGSGAFDLTLANTENLTAGRTLTITVNDVARTLNMGGNITTGGAFTTSGANSLTFTTTGATNVTVPVTGTLATLAGAESLTNKKLGSLTTNGYVTTSGGDGTLGITSASGILDTFSSTRGSVLYRGASGWAALTPGTSGQVLQTNGAGADPSWATVSGGGAVSSVSNSDTTLTISPTTGAVVASLNLAKANTWTGLQTLTIDNATTNAVTTVLDVQKSSTGTPAAGMGARIRFGLESSTTANQDAGAIETAWAIATHASRSARMSLFVNSTTTSAEVLRLLPVPSAVNYAYLLPSGTATPIEIGADGTDTDIDITLAPKGAGIVTVNTVPIALQGDITTSGMTMNAARLLGRTTGGSGAIEEITAGSGLSLSGGGLALAATVVRTDQGNTYTTGAQDFGLATSLTVPTASGAAPTVSGTIAYDATANALEYGDGGTNRTVANLDEAQTFTNKTISGASNTLSNIANASLTNSAITIAGTSTSLGGSITRDTITGVSSNGILARTGANALTNRTLTAGSASITVTNGDGVSGNPAIDTAQNITTSGAPSFANITSTGGFAADTLTSSGNATLAATEFTVLCNATGAVRTYTLPAAASHSGRIFVVKKTDSSANACIIDGNSTETIDGNLTVSVYGQYDSVTIQSDGSNWFRLGAQLVSAEAGYINGLNLEFVSTTQVRVTSGAAQIQSTGQILVVPTALTISPSLSSNTWYHCYVYDNSGVGALECVTTAPATAWVGTARAKTSDTTRRYVGSIRTNGSSQLFNFLTEGSGSLQIIRWRNDVTNDNRILTNGSASTNTNVDASSRAPVTSRAIEVTIYNLATGGVAYFDTSDAGSSGTGLDPDSAIGLFALNSGAINTTYLPLNSSQVFRYSYSGSPTGTNFIYIDVLSYRIGR